MTIDIGRLKEIRHVVSLMEARLEYGQGTVASSMCRLSLPMTRDLVSMVEYLIGGVGETGYNVLALLDCYQDTAIGAESAMREIRRILDEQGCSCEHVKRKCTACKIRNVESMFVARVHRDSATDGLIEADIGRVTHAKQALRDVQQSHFASKASGHGETFDALNDACSLLDGVLKTLTSALEQQRSLSDEWENRRR